MHLHHLGTLLLAGGIAAGSTVPKDTNTIKLDRSKPVIVTFACVPHDRTVTAEEIAYVEGLGLKLDTLMCVSTDLNLVHKDHERVKRLARERGVEQWIAFGFVPVSSAFSKPVSLKLYNTIPDDPWKAECTELRARSWAALVKQLPNYLY